MCKDARTTKSHVDLATLYLLSEALSGKKWQMKCPYGGFLYEQYLISYWIILLIAICTGFWILTLAFQYCKFQICRHTCQERVYLNWFQVFCKTATESFLILSSYICVSGRECYNLLTKSAFQLHITFTKRVIYVLRSRNKILKALLQAIVTLHYILHTIEDTGCYKDGDISFIIIGPVRSSIC